MNPPLLRARAKPAPAPARTASAAGARAASPAGLHAPPRPSASTGSSPPPSSSTAPSSPRHISSSLSTLSPRRATSRHPILPLSSFAPSSSRKSVMSPSFTHKPTHPATRASRPSRLALALATLALSSFLAFALLAPRLHAQLGPLSALRPDLEVQDGRLAARARAALHARPARDVPGGPQGLPASPIVAPPSPPAAHRTWTAPPPAFPHACHVVGVDPRKNLAWLFNTRAFCLTSAICIRPSTPSALPHLYTAAHPSTTRCLQTNADLSPSLSTHVALNCSHFQATRVHRAHGKYRATNYPHPPVIRPFSMLSTPVLHDARWLDADAVVVVPAFPYLGNIFHFSFVAGTVTHVVTSLSGVLGRWRLLPPTRAGPSRVVVLFRGQPVSAMGRWQTAIFAALLRHRMRTPDVSVDVFKLGENPLGGGTDIHNDERPVCMRTAVLLGDRGNVNLWPFPNGTAVSRAGRAVPEEAVFFRRAIYNEFSIPTRLPRARRESMTFELPPLVVGYSRRGAEKDPKQGEYLRGPVRRFSQADDTWFVRMLRAEARRRGVEVREIRVTGRESVEEQVRLFADVGFVVGIHGANLVNAMFVRPFGAVMEIHPGGSVLECYMAGANSGLAYFNHEAEKATPEESNCPPWNHDCWKYFRERRVKIDDMLHRSQIRRKVREGLKHLQWLHREFPTGVPVRFDPTETQYVIDGN